MYLKLFYNVLHQKSQFSFKYDSIPNSAVRDGLFILFTILYVCEVFFRINVWLIVLHIRFLGQFQTILLNEIINHFTLTIKSGIDYKNQSRVL